MRSDRQERANGSTGEELADQGCLPADRVQQLLQQEELADYPARVTGKRKAGRMPRRSSELAG